MEQNKVNSRDRRIIITIIIGIVCAVIAAFLVYFYLSPQRTAVYVFNEDYPAGTVITRDMVSAVKCDTTILVEGQSEDVSDVFVAGDNNLDYVISTGDSLRMDVSAGMPLTTSMLSVNGGSSIEVTMDPSTVAVTIDMTDTRAVSSDIKEGSRVNVYFTGGDMEGTTLLFQGMPILSIARDEDGAITAVTLQCTTDQSLELVYAEEYGSLYLGLVDSSGYQYIDGQPSYAPVLSE